MQIRKLLMTVLCLLFSLSISAQTDSSSTNGNHEQSKGPFNFTKLELVYQKERVTHTEYGANHMPRYSTSRDVDFPYIRIDGNEPKPLEKNVNILRPYYIKAPLASEQLELADEQYARAQMQCWTLMGAGVITIFSGVIAATNAGDKGTSKFIIRTGIGSLIGFAGAYLGRYHNQKAEKLVKLSLDIYNDKYYKPILIDSTSTTNTSDSSHSPLQ